MDYKIVMAGFGGQGIMAMGQLSTFAGMVEGKEVSWLPSYGPEMRGGAANCCVIISEDPIGAPSLTSYNVGVFMNQLSFDKFIDNAEPGGKVFTNADLVNIDTDRDDIQIFNIPVNKIAAEEIGNARTANMVMLGAVVGETGMVKADTIMEVFTEVFGEHRAKLKPMNKEAMAAGAAAVKDSLVEI